MMMGAERGGKTSTLCKKIFVTISECCDRSAMQAVALKRRLRYGLHGCGGRFKSRIGLDCILENAWRGRTLASKIFKLFDNLYSINRANWFGMKVEWKCNQYARSG
jgi:hypothetical protein